jgi:hypothetical protein
MEELKKEDYALVAMWRRTPHTRPQLWKMPVSELRLLVGQPTVDERARLEVAQRNRRLYRAARSKAEGRAAALRQKMQELGLTASQGMTNGGMVDTLLARGPDGEDGQIDARIYPPQGLAGRFPDKPDEYQQSAIDRAVALTTGRTAGEADGRRRLLISAGPGAGKTTTVCAFVAACLQAQPAARVLVLAFNVGAEAELLRRLRSLGVALMPRTQVGRDAASRPAGCAVLTFDKMAYRVVDSSGLCPPPNEEGDTFQREKKRAARMAAVPGQSPAAAGWDLVVVDEAQDVAPEEAAMAETLVKTAGAALVAAGDPRQEIYQGCTWFSKAWATAPPAEQAVLQVNYRSHPHIVRALNDYSRAAFPTLHHDQIPAQAAEDEEESAVWVHECSGDSTALGLEVAGLLAEREPHETYAVAPFSIEKFQLGGATFAARQRLHELRPGEKTVALAGAAKMPAGERGRPAPVYLAATARRIKGTERERVVAYGFDVPYERYGIEEADLRKCIFVQLSRARRELHVLLGSPTTGDEIRPAHRAQQLLTPVLRAAGRTVRAAPAVRASVPLPPIGPLPMVGSSDGATGRCAAQVPWAPRRSEDSAESSSSHFADLTNKADAAPRRAFGAAECEGPSLEPLVQAIAQEEVKGDADFIGCLAEAHIYQALGFELLPAAHLAPEFRLAPDNAFAVRDDGVATLCIRENLREPRARQQQRLVELRREVEDFLCQAEEQAYAQPYVYAVLGFTALGSRRWTVSERLADPELNRRIQAAARDCAAYLRRLAATAGANPERPKMWRKIILHTLRDSRFHSPDDASAIAGRGVHQLVAYQPDIVFCDANGAARLVVELKHAACLRPAHRAQLAGYMATETADVPPCGALYNTRTGAVELYRGAAGDAAAFNLRARAVVALSQARIVGRQWFANERLQPPRVLTNGAAATLIAVDAEEDSRGLLEIGAVAFSLRDSAPVAVFQERCPSARQIPQRPEAEARADGDIGGLIGLRRELGGVDDPREEHRELLRRFQEWVRGCSDGRVFLHWGGSERQLVTPVGAADALGPCHDVLHNTFRPWLESRGRGREGGLALSDAADQIFPDRGSPQDTLAFTPHQAFEDALMTLAIFLALTSFAGQV